MGRGGMPGEAALYSYSSHFFPSSLPHPPSPSPSPSPSCRRGKAQKATRRQRGRLPRPCGGSPRRQACPGTVVRRRRYASKQTRGRPTPDSDSRGRRSAGGGVSAAEEGRGTAGTGDQPRRAVPRPEIRVGKLAACRRRIRTGLRHRRSRASRPAGPPGLGVPRLFALPPVVRPALPPRISEDPPIMDLGVLWARGKA